MRFIHLADLHIGKTIYGKSLLESGDQRHWVERFLEKAEQLRPDAVVIAGDVYDRSAPSGEAVALLSALLTALAELEIPVMLVAGNHDSAQRLAFAGELLARQGLHISRPLAGTDKLASATLWDDHGPVTFWLMPYVFPALIAQALGEDVAGDYTAAVRALLARQDVDFSQRNVLIAHQNVTAGGVEAARGGSESMVGGVGQVEYTAFDGFDYVALGHIHAAYAVGRESVRYAGTPLCYHFDELRQREKGPLLVELGAKGEPVSVELVRIPPLHPMRELRGEYEAIRDGELQNPRRGEYLRVALTDRRVSPQISAFFRDLCQARDSALMELVSEYNPYAVPGAIPGRRAEGEKSVEALFEAFYTERRGGVGPDEAERGLLALAGERLRHGDPHAQPTQRDIDAMLSLLLEQEASE